MAGSPGKTPVSLLQEICTRKNCNPKYELLQVEGAVHEPVFQYRLFLNFNGADLDTTGNGRSKKEAKHNTALAMLSMMGVVSQGASSMDRQEQDAVVPDGSSTIDDSDLGGSNPVGLLQELCMKVKHPPPTYEVHSEEGLPHERIFAMACRVGEHYVEIGRGKSKKLAKRQAAALMAERLKNIPSETTHVYDFDEDDDKICERIAMFLQKKPKSDADGSLLAKCRNIAKHKFGNIQKEESAIEDPIKLLDGMEDSFFKAIYIDFDELSTRGEYQCFVHMTTDPPIVAIGEGASRDMAKINAARDAVNIFTDLLLESS